MTQEDLQKKIEALKITLKTNSNDANATEKAIDELLSLKGQSMIEPTLLHIPTSDIKDSLNGETFILYKTKQGLLYHQKNGFNLHIPLNGMVNGLYEHAMWLIENKDKVNTFDEGMKQYYHTTLIELAYTFQLLFGMWITDVDFMAYRMKTIDSYIDLLERKIKEQSEKPLQEDNHEENAEFERTMMAIENLKEEVKEELKKEDKKTTD